MITTKNGGKETTYLPTKYIIIISDTTHTIVRYSRAPCSQLRFPMVERIHTYITLQRHKEKERKIPLNILLQHYFFSRGFCTAENEGKMSEKNKRFSSVTVCSFFMLPYMDPLFFSSIRIQSSIPLISFIICTTF